MIAREDQAEPSGCPYGDAETNEFKWLNWAPNDDDQKAPGKKIHQGFVEWTDLVKEAAVEAAKPDGDTFRRWFGKQDPPSEIKKIFGNMWTGSEANAKVSGMVLWRNDFAAYL